MRRFGEWLLQHRNNALFTVIAIMLVSTTLQFVGWMAAVIMCFVTLRKGPKEGAFLLVWLALPQVVQLVQGAEPMVLLNFVTEGVCVWLFAVILRQSQSWQWVIEAGTLLAMIAVIGVYLWMPDVESWWLVRLATFYQQANGALFPTLPKEALTHFTQQMSLYMTSFQVLMVLSSGLINLLLARWWQALLFRTGGLRKELHGLRLGHAMLALLVIAGVLLLVQQHWSHAVLPIALFPLFLVGLSVIHCVIGQLKTAWFLLGLFYGLLIVFFPYVAGVVMLVALADKWVNFRVRGKKSGSHITNKNS